MWPGLFGHKPGEGDVKKYRKRFLSFFLMPSSGFRASRSGGRDARPTASATFSHPSDGRRNSGFLLLINPRQFRASRSGRRDACPTSSRRWARPAASICCRSPKNPSRAHYPNPLPSRGEGANQPGESFHRFGQHHDHHRAVLLTLTHIGDGLGGLDTGGGQQVGFHAAQRVHHQIRAGDLQRRHAPAL